MTGFAHRSQVSRQFRSINDHLTNCRFWSYTHIVTNSSTRTGILSDRKARAERILDAAAELLLRAGVTNGSRSMTSLSVLAGKGTIYLHWKSREELFQAVLQRSW